MPGHNRQAVPRFAVPIRPLAELQPAFDVDPRALNELGGVVYRRLVEDRSVDPRRRLAFADGDICAQIGFALRRDFELAIAAERSE